jgi:cyclase
MGLAVRIIPTLLTRGRTLVKGVAFDSWRSVGLAQQAVRIHSMRGVDELVMLDISATPEGRGPDLGLVSELAEVCFMPLTVGGGIRTVQDVDNLLRAGADKVCIRAAAEARPHFITECADRFGSQAIVFSLDVPPGARKTHPAIAASRVEKLGAGEIMLTAMEREGAMQGYDLGLIQSVTEAVSIPVIAHGGCGGYQHMLEAIRAGANAVAAGALFQFTDATPLEAAHWLANQGVETRIQS